MSHFLVAVFHRRNQDYDDLLSPYSENLSVEPYMRFTREEAIDYARKNWSGYEEKSDDECWQAVADDYDSTDDFGNIYSTYNPKSKWIGIVKAEDGADP